MISKFFKKILIPSIASSSLILPLAFFTNENNLSVNNNVSHKDSSQKYISGNNSLNGNLSYGFGIELAEKLDWNANLPNMIMNFVKSHEPQKSFQQIINENQNVINPKFIDLLNKINNENITGWTLVLSSSFWEDFDLGDLSFLSNLKNISSIVIRVNNIPSLTNSLGTTFNLASIKKLSWINSLPYLSQLEISFESGLDDSAEINFDYFSFMQDNNSIKRLNISSFYNKNDHNKNIIKGDLLAQKWFYSKRINFEIMIPASFKMQTDDKYLVKKITFNNGEYLLLTKNSYPPLQKPSWDDNSPILIDGKVVNAVVYNGIWYWDIEDVNTLKRIRWANIDSRKYFTSINQPPQTKKIISSSIDQTLNSSELRDMLMPLPKNAFSLSAKNISAVSDLKVSINSKEYDYYVVDSRMYLNFELDRIRFAIEDNKKMLYYTSYASIPSKFINDISSVRVKSEEDFVAKKFVSLTNPSSYKDVLYVGEKTVKPMIYKGIFYWSFEKAGIDISNIKFISKSRNFLAENFIDFSLLQTMPSDINYLSKSIDNKQLGARLTGGEKVTLINLKEFENTPKFIVIDDKKYGQIIYEGNIYYDTDIKKIKFKYDDGNIIKYYTDWDYIKSNNVNISHLTEISQLEKYDDFTLKNIKLPSQLNLDSEITINGSTFGTSLRQGKVFWSEKVAQLIKDIKYVDKFGYYYTEIKDNLPQKISQVKRINEYSLDNAIKDTLVHTKRLSVEAILSIFQGILVDRNSINSYFLNSELYIDSITDPIKYIYNFRNRLSNEFFTNSSFITSFNIKKTSEIEYLSVNIRKPDFDLFPVINDPKSIDDTINILSENGTMIVIEAIKDSKGNLYWNDYNKINQIKYQFKSNDDLYYAISLSSKNVNEDYMLSSVVANNATEFLTDSKIKRDIKRTESDHWLYISVAAIGSIFIGVATYIGIYVMKLRNK